jgi:hypothetical protein
MNIQWPEGTTKAEKEGASAALIYGVDVMGYALQLSGFSTGLAATALRIAGFIVEESVRRQTTSVIEVSEVSQTAVEMALEAFRENQKENG